MCSYESLVFLHSLEPTSGEKYNVPKDTNKHWRWLHNDGNKTTAVVQNHPIVDELCSQTIQEY